jgi:hypothetical protein
VGGFEDGELLAGRHGTYCGALEPLANLVRICMTYTSLILLLVEKNVEMEETIRYHQSLTGVPLRGFESYL